MRLWHKDYNNLLCLELLFIAEKPAFGGLSTPALRWQHFHESAFHKNNSTIVFPKKSTSTAHGFSQQHFHDTVLLTKVFPQHSASHNSTSTTQCFSQQYFHDTVLLTTVLPRHSASHNSTSTTQCFSLKYVHNTVLLTKVLPWHRTSNNNNTIMYTRP